VAGATATGTGEGAEEEGATPVETIEAEETVAG